MPTNIDTPVAPAARSGSEFSEQIDRILRSQQFRGTETLRNLLSYLAACTSQGRGDSPGVREIAKAVFGRSEDFDSQNDSVVRVHAGRLRSKLAEYYMEEGADDDLIVAMPKGSYGLVWHRRHGPSALATITPSAISPVISAPMQPAAVVEKRRRIPVWSIVLMASAIASIVTWFGGNAIRQRNGASGAINTFWRGFAAPDESPLVVFSNFRFVESVDRTLQSIDEKTDVGKPIIDTYTTVGEVMGVFKVSEALAMFHKSPRVKRGRLLTWDEAKDNSLIFIGGPLAETPLRDVQMLREFKFVERTWSTSGAIRNLKPAAGEQALYSVPIPYPATHSTNSLTDYAIVALRPGLSRNRRILILAGITEYGTQGAAEFATSREGLEELARMLGQGSGGSTPWFEAVLRVPIEGGVPLQASIEALHRLK